MRFIGSMLALALALHALLFPVVLASFRVVTPQRDNASVADIDHQLALFGRPKFGSGLVAALALAPETDSDACKPLDPVALQSSLADQGIVVSTGTDGGETEPFVLLVERGNCHFVEKARQAQAAGAAAVVVYDTGDDSAKLPVLADDGTGGDIRIPSLLIHHKDAQTLQTQLEAHVKTIVAIRWDVPHPDDRVEFSLWFSSRSAPSVHAFVETFRDVVRALGDAVLFTPQYDVHLGSSWGCSRERSDARPLHCPDLCVLDEQFCAYDPERNNTVGLDGNDVLEEDVRQLCIYEHAQQTANSSMLFWEYLTRFHAKCSVSNATKEQFNQACSEAVQRELGIVDAVAACAQDDAKAAQLLQSQVDALHEFHVIEFPELTVNGVPMYGGLACSTPISLATCAPLSMICAGFVDGHAPEACQDTYWKARAGCVAPLERDDCGQCNERESLDWNAQCVGCDGVLHSGKRYDPCGVCGGHGSLDVCGRCLPANDLTRDSSCVDCKGVPLGLAQRDACGICDGHGSFDACGLCLDAADPRRQNFACHVIEDPDAVAAKVEIQGFGMRQFKGDVVTSFQEAVAFLSDVTPEHVVVKTVDDITRAKSSVAVLFFIACTTDTCREDVTKRLQDPSASQLITMKMKSSLDSTAYGLERSKLIQHVSLHSVNTGGGMFSTSSMVIDEGGSVRWTGIVVACGLTLAAGIVLMRVRDERMRRDFRELFARYTPLTSMDHEDDSEVGRHPSAGADAW